MSGPTDNRFYREAQPASKDLDICTKCGWSLQACDCCGLCGEPECDCAEELNGDTSEPLGDSFESLGLTQDDFL